MVNGWDNYTNMANTNYPYIMFMIINFRFTLILKNN